MNYHRFQIHQTKMFSFGKDLHFNISFINVADYALQLYWIGSFMQQVHRIIAVSTMIQLSQDQSYVWTHKIAIAWMFMRPCIGMIITMLTNNLDCLERSGYNLYISNTDTTLWKSNTHCILSVCREHPMVIMIAFTHKCVLEEGIGIS